MHSGGVFGCNEASGRYIGVVMGDTISVLMHRSETSVSVEGSYAYIWQKGDDEDSSIAIPVDSIDAIIRALAQAKLEIEGER